MPKLYIGIDPGLSKTGLAAIDEQDRILLTSLILVSPTKKQKTVLDLDKKRTDLVNYKLAQIKNRLEATLTELIKDYDRDDIVVTVESFAYYAPKKDQRNMVNFIYETIAGITMTKCVLINLNLKWQEILPSQLKRTITLLAEGVPRVKVTKEEVQACIIKLLNGDKAEQELQQYAKNYQEHIADALAICKASRHTADYKKYMKLSEKKRKDWKLSDE